MRRCLRAISPARRQHMGPLLGGGGGQATQGCVSSKGRGAERLRLLRLPLLRNAASSARPPEHPPGLGSLSYRPAFRGRAFCRRPFADVASRRAKASAELPRRPRAPSAAMLLCCRHDPAAVMLLPPCCCRHAAVGGMPARPVIPARATPDSPWSVILRRDSPLRPRTPESPPVEPLRHAADPDVRRAGFSSLAAEARACASGKTLLKSPRYDAPVLQNDGRGQ